MKINAYIRLLAVLTFSFFLFSRCVNAQGTVLIAHYYANSFEEISNDFLDSIQRSGYKYLQAQCDMDKYGSSDWLTTSGKPNGLYNWNTGSPRKYYNGLVDLFKRANQRNLKVIPAFEIGCCHSAGWASTNSNISFNSFTGDPNLMTAMAPDPNGIDRSYASIIDVIFHAFKDAKTNYKSLDYINIGHDEMVSGDKSDNNNHFFEYYIAASLTVDRNWLINRVNSMHETYEQAYYDLIANEVNRRVTTLKNTGSSYGQNTQILIFADMFDPQGNGNPPNTNFWALTPDAFGNWVNHINLKTMKVLACKDIQDVRGNIVLNPWQFSRVYGDTYYTDSTIAYLRNNGFLIVGGSAYWCDPITHIVNVDGINQMHDWVRASALPENINSVIGQVVFNWNGNDGALYWKTNPRSQIFNILRDLTNTAPISPALTTSPNPTQTFMADVNGDGRSDIVTFRSNGVYVSLAHTDGRTFDAWTRWSTDFAGNAGWGSECPCLMADVNGDGKADIVGFGNGGVIVGISDGIKFTSQSWSVDFGYNAGWRVAYHPRLMADVTGDGKADIVGFANGNVVVGRSTGTSFVSEAWSTDFCYNQGWQVPYTPRLMADVNGDGKADVVGFSNDGVIVGISNGKSFTSQRWNFGLGYNNGWRVDQHCRMTGFVNTDKMADIIAINASGQTQVFLSNGSTFIQQ